MARRLDEEWLHNALEDTFDHGGAHSVGAWPRTPPAGVGLGLNALAWFPNQKGHCARRKP
jgi:hypothetical protein